MLARNYDALGGKVGRHSMRVLIDEIRGVRDYKWNEEYFVVFQTAILKCVCHVTNAQAIIRRIGKYLDARQAGQKNMLVD